MFYLTPLVLENSPNNQTTPIQQNPALDQRHIPKNQDQDMKEEEVGLNTQEREQEPVDAGQMHEGN